MSSRFPELTRRSFVRIAAGTAGAWGLGVLAACETDPTRIVPEPQFGKGNSGGGKGGKGGGTRYPLRIPATQAPTGDLTVAPTQVDLGDGKLRTVWSYNGQFPGPTLVARKDQTTASPTLINRLADETITHWHGMLVDHANDGHPVFAIPPGGSYAYNFKIEQRATMNWYHPHPHGRTGEQVAMGLAGAFIIRDSEEDALELPSGPREVPLIIRDASFDRAGDMQYKPRSGGFEGNTLLVNGTLNPTLDVDAALYRLRILNGCNARIFRFALSNGEPFTIIGNDGGFLPAPATETAILLSPGERLDLLVDFAEHAGTTVMLQDLNAGWDLLELVVDSKNVNDSASIPTTLPTIIPLGTPVREREFSFDGMSKINGQLYEMDRVDFQVPFGDVELWRFTTNGNAPHPVHVHGAYFQVLSRSGGRGGPPLSWERGWKDTVLLEDGETVEIKIRFDTHKGLYLMHCHKLEHEDMGMMSNFEVV